MAETTEVYHVQRGTLLLLKGMAEAMEHCTQTQVIYRVVTAIYASEMATAAKARLTFRIRLCRTSKMYGKPPRYDHGSLSTPRSIFDVPTTFPILIS